MKLIRRNKGKKTNAPPVLDISLSLVDILDVPAIQAMMKAFSDLTKMCFAIVDMQGRVLIATGWQDICTKFHRQHPETNRHCIESDTMLTSGVQPGTFKMYRCKNNMWDIATPIVVEGKQVGNLFSGQFFFEDEIPDYEVFRLAAKQYGFDETEYLAALSRVPRWSRETVNQLMEFYTRFANLVSKLSLNNNRLEQTVAARTQELIAQNEEITAMNEEIAVLNQNLTRMNEELEQRVAERTTDLMAAHQELNAQVEELEQSEEKLRRRAEIQTVLREIAEAAVQTPSLDELYRAVHRLVGRVLPAKQFHLNLLDEATGEIVVPFNADAITFIPTRRPIDKGMTEYIMGLGHAVHITPNELERLIMAGEYSLAYAQNVQPRHYLGAPLIDSRGKPFGVMSLIMLGDSQAFQPEDVEVLSIITAQVSMAIERKRAEDAVCESEERYRAVMKQAPEAVLICDPETGAILEANSRFSERFGYDLNQSGLLSIFELEPDQRENVEKALTQARQNGFLPLQRRVLRHRNGVDVQVERSATLVHYRDRSLLVQTMRDVSDEVRREAEIRRDAELAKRVQNAMLTKAISSEHLLITTIYEPYSYVGGDLYFMDWRYGGTLLRGFLVDTAGHGLGTALHTASLHVLLREVNEQDLPLTNSMRWLNRRAGAYFDEGTFASALGFELDLETRQLRWSCAGIPKVWVATQTQQGALKCPGMCLGISEDESFELNELSIAVGDSLYFLTDGFTGLLEERNELPLGRYPEMVGLLQTLTEASDRRDDAAAVCIHVRSLPQSLVRQDGWPRILRFCGYGDYQRMRGEMGKILEEVTGKKHSVHEVAVHEALANAMECRDGIPRQHNAWLRFNKVGNRFIVRVKTSRIGFAGNAMLRRLRSHPEDMFSFGEDAGMGRGIPIMLSIADRMTYNNEGNELLLAWRL